MTEPSTDYHDYVFQNGKLVGDFEGMYRHSSQTPWQQHLQQDWIDIRLTIELLRDLAPFDELHDFGCGLGYYLELLREALAPAARCVGYDVSATACGKAKQLFPASEFRQLDLTATDAPMPLGEAQQSASRLLAFRGTLWYVFPEIHSVVDNLATAATASDWLVVVQNFPPLDSDFIGKSVLPNHHALIDHFARRFELKRHIWYEDLAKKSNDNWFIGMFKTRSGQ